jgi:hypothetical protein
VSIESVSVQLVSAVSESTSWLLVSPSFSSVKCNAKKWREEVSAVGEQWHCCEVTSEKRTDLRSISGYRWWNSNCSPYP